MPAVDGLVLSQLGHVGQRSENSIRQFLQRYSIFENISNFFENLNSHPPTLISVRAGFVILIALSFLMPTFYYIPKSVLGAVIIVAVYSMVEFDEILPMWRGRSMHALQSKLFTSPLSKRGCLNWVLIAVFICKGSS
jgi:hypothetical protein